MLCEQYRDGLMALLDGELPDPQRRQVEDHLHRCPVCHTEFRQFEKITHLAHHVHFASPNECIWRNYWRGVCNKMDARAHWSSWAGGSLLLVSVGMLMSFGYGPSALAVTLGGVAVLIGVGLLWLSYFCNCKR